MRLFYIINIILFIFYTKNCFAKNEAAGMPQMSIPDFMPQLVWLCIVFPLLYLSMKYIALPRISQIISNRALKISNNINKAEEIRDKIVQANKEHEIAVETTNLEIKKIINNINIKATEEAEKKLQKCQSEINDKIQKEKTKLEKEILKFNRNIESISLELVQDMAKKIYNQEPETKILKTKINKYAERYSNE